jgi:hypothetical protein|tara:strand:+ start:1160 stop:1363 length:204 start_codon:yes stop_codon:yes gene_type:complete
MNKKQYHNLFLFVKYLIIMKKGMMKEILKGLKPQLKMGKLTKQLLGELNDEKKHRFNQLRKSLIRLT